MTQSSFVELTDTIDDDCGTSYRAPHRQRLLMFRYSRNKQNRYENLMSHQSAASGATLSSQSFEIPPVTASKRFSIRKCDQQYQSMTDDNSVDDSDGSTMTTITTTTTASSASSPVSTSHKRQLTLTPAHQRQLQFRRRIQQQKMCNIRKVQHSDPSSSDDGLPIAGAQSVHRVASAICMAHNKTIAPAGLIAETFELKALPSPASSVSSYDTNPHRLVAHEDSLKTTTSTLSPKTVSSDQDTVETNLSLMRRDSKSTTAADDSPFSKRSKSYHGKGQYKSIAVLLLDVQEVEAYKSINESLDVVLLSMDEYHKRQCCTIRFYFPFTVNVQGRGLVNI